MSEKKKVSGTIVHQFFPRSPPSSHRDTQVPLHDHLLDPRRTSVRLSLEHTAPHGTQLFTRLSLIHPIPPRERAFHRPLMHRDRSGSPHTAPAPLFHSLNQARAYRIAFHVATDRIRNLGSGMSIDLSLSKFCLGHFRPCPHAFSAQHLSWAYGQPFVVRSCYPTFLMVALSRPYPFAFGCRASRNPTSTC